MTCLYPFVFIGLIFTFDKTIAQEISSNQSPAYKNIKAYYEKEIGGDSHLFTGKEYAPYKSGIQGSQFFISPQMQNSTIFYDGAVYEDVPLLFDQVRQVVVINRYEDNTRIKLLNEKIKYFIISGHRFENIILSEGNIEDINSGFYDIIFSGRASAMVSRIKKVEMTLNPEDPPKFTERDKIFIRNRNIFFPVDNAASIIRALNDKKDLVRTFIRKNKFRFKKNTEEELVKTVTYYETLIN
ncbi:MAG: hypothetical protein ABI419_09615 [Ginsengibacter sp.]